MTGPSGDWTGRGKARHLEGLRQPTVNSFSFSSTFEWINRHTNTVQKTCSPIAVRSDFPICSVLLAMCSQGANAILPSWSVIWTEKY